jgi:hypothetical protein
MCEKPPVAEQASFPPKTCIAYKKLALALIAQRSGSARAASSGPTALPKPRQVDKQRCSDAQNCIAYKETAWARRDCDASPALSSFPRYQR